jgi:hypothetical protein
MSEWISCKDRLPKTNGNTTEYYIIQDEWGLMSIATFHEGCWKLVGALIPVVWEVVAWMPAPKAYEE